MKFDLRERTCIVTGASTGIGREIARNLAYFGATVVLACRDRDRGGAALQDIAEDSGNDNLRMLLVDLSSQSSIRAFVRNFLVSSDKLHVLVNNAGVMTKERQKSPDGHELTWATNVLGYHLLTKLLLPVLEHSGPSRVVNVASRYAFGLDLDDVNFERRKFTGRAAYAQSKQADRMLTWGLAERAKDRGIVAHACHPGGVKSELYREQGLMNTAIESVGKLFLKTPRQGAVTPTWVAANPELEGKTAGYWVDEKSARCKFRDPAQVDRLWDLCEQMTK